MNTETGQQVLTARDWMGRALALYLRLNADRMNYTPLSHKGARAWRLCDRIAAAMKARA